MRKLHVVGIALVALFVFNAMAMSAFATEPLLAEWLLDGEPIPSGTINKVLIQGKILLEDNKVPIVGKAAVECEGLLEGWVGENGLDYISEVLNIENVEILSLSGEGLLCAAEAGCEKATTSSPIEVWPNAELLSKGWETVLLLNEHGLFEIMIYKSGYQVLCLVLGTMVEDECNSEESGVEVVNGTSGAEIPASAIAEPPGNCTEGGAGTGVNESVTAAQIVPTEGTGELTVSSEGAGR